MSDLQGPVTIPEGQPLAAPEGTTEPAPEGRGGQAPEIQPQGSGQVAVATPDEPTFFDPNDLSPELQPAYKQMQAAFTKKMQAISTERQKVEAYNAFMADPVGNLQRMAQQYGYQMTRGEAQAALQGQQQSHGQQWEPQTWDDVMSRAKQEVMQEVLQQFAPIIQTVQKVQAGNIETQLNTLDPAWRMYEDEMRANLQAHPSLVNDVAKLYRLSVPDEVWASKATQKALKKLEDKATSAQVAERGTTSRSAPAPAKVSSFAEAWEFAKQQQK